MDKPECCGKCGAEPQERKRCPRCGEAEWVLHHGAHYMQGAREVISCDCPALHSALGKRMEEARVRQEERELTGKRPRGRPGKDRPVTMPEMAKKAAEGLAQGLGPTVALREAGFPEWTANRGRRGINRMVRAEFGKLGRKYIQMGRDLTPEDQELLVRGMLFENVVLKTDKGVQAAKQLGADKRISMWQPDAQA
ncbi:MAG TPA: hypothetical protein VF740_09600, partial [Candidatus Acidoferrum sp.]